MALLSCSMRCAAVVALTLVFHAPVAFAAVVYVDDSAPAGGDGKSWNTAYRSLRTALRVAKAGDVIRVGQGVYRPARRNGSRTATFLLREGVILQGGYAGYGAPNPNRHMPSRYKTILSGDLNANDTKNFHNLGDNSLHVITIKHASPATQLRGLWITAGNADANSPDSPHAHGGGVRCLGDARPTIINCVIRRNRAAWSGAGLHAPKGSPIIKSSIIRDNVTVNLSGHGAGVNVRSGKIDRCTFMNNHAGTASTGGGGVRAVGSNAHTFRLTNCTFLSNASAGVFCGRNAIIRNCNFSSNNAEDGAGIIITGRNVAVIDCMFEANTAASFGGALHTQPDASAIVINCRFLNNSSAAGHAVCNRGQLTLVNCVLVGNNALFSGGNGAIRNHEGSLDIINCTIAHNAGEGPGAGVFVHAGQVAIHNTILWSNGLPPAVATEHSQLHLAGGTLAVNACCVQGWTGDFGGQHNTGEDPQFVDPAGRDQLPGTADDDLRLSPESPCVNLPQTALQALPNDQFDLDRDNITAEIIPLDIDGRPRVVGQSIDAGAYELQ